MNTPLHGIQRCTSRRRTLGAVRCIAAAVVLAALLLVALAPASALATGAQQVALSPQAVAYSPAELALVEMINDYRTSHGVPTVLISDILSDSSSKHNLDMGKYHFFNHYTVQSDWFVPGASPGNRMVACGYPTFASWGENLAANWPSVEVVFTRWVNSPTHNTNMLSPTWKVVGISVDDIAGSDEGTYYATDYGDFVDATAHAPGGSAPPDLTSPSVWFTNPADGAQVSGRVSFTVSASDNLGVSRVELYAGGALLGTGNSSSYTCTWDTSGMSPGIRLVEARAYDAAGNVGFASISVYIMPDPATTTTTTTVDGGAAFADVKPGNVFYGEITALARDGIISGGSDGLFHPDNPVTRAQFAKIIILALDRHTPAIDSARPPSFTDVPFTGTDYPYDYVEEAAALFIIQGYQDGTFRPQANVTRGQIALMLTRAGSAGLTVPPADYVCPFTDVPPYAREAVRTAVYNSLVNGKAATLFDPSCQATRGQVAKMVYRLRQALGF